MASRKPRMASGDSPVFSPADVSSQTLASSMEQSCIVAMNHRMVPADLQPKQLNIMRSQLREAVGWASWLRCEGETVQPWISSPLWSRTTRMPNSSRTSRQICRRMAGGMVRTSKSTRLPLALFSTAPRRNSTIEHPRQVSGQVASEPEATHPACNVQVSRDKIHTKGKSKQRTQVTYAPVNRLRVIQRGGSPLGGARRADPVAEVAREGRSTHLGDAPRGPGLFGSYAQVELKLLEVTHSSSTASA